MSNALKRIDRVTGQIFAATPLAVTAFLQDDSKATASGGATYGLDAERAPAESPAGLPAAVPSAGDGTAAVVVRRGRRTPADRARPAPLAAATAAVPVAAIAAAP